MTTKYEHDYIARIAYRSWLDRGQPDGSPEVDWYYAVSIVTNPQNVCPKSMESGPLNDFASHEAEAVDGHSLEHEADAADDAMRGDLESTTPRPRRKPSSGGNVKRREGSH